MRPEEVGDWVDFLKSNGAKNIIDYGEWVGMDCLFHEQSDNSRPSLGINKESGCGNCFGCGVHFWEEFCELFGLDATDFIDAPRGSLWESLRKRIRPIEEGFKRYKLPNDLRSITDSKEAVDYFKKRHFQIDYTANYTHWCGDKSSKYYDCIIFPIMDPYGVIYFDARYVGKLDKPRWRSPKDSPKDRAFYNFPYGKKLKYLCFTEGASDALKMTQFGIKNTIAAKYFSDIQFKYINMCCNFRVLSTKR